MVYLPFGLAAYLHGRIERRGHEKKEQVHRESEQMRQSRRYGYDTSVIPKGTPIETEIFVQIFLIL